MTTLGLSFLLNSPLQACGPYSIDSFQLSEIRFANSKNESARQKAMKQLKVFAQKWNREKAIAWSESISNDSIKQLAIPDVVSLWAQREPQKAAKWAITFEDDHLRNYAIAAVVNVWAHKDLEKAIALSEKIDEDYSFLLSKISKTFASYDFEKTLAWIEHFKKDEQSVFIKHAAAIEVANVNAQKAIKLALTINSKKQKEKTLRAILGIHAKKNPKEAVVLSEKILKGKDLYLVKADIVSKWVREDILQAKKLAMSIEDDVYQSIGLKYVALEQAIYNKNKGILIAKNIKDEWYRNAALREIEKFN